MENENEKKIYLSENKILLLSSIIFIIFKIRISYMKILFLYLFASFIDHIVTELKNIFPKFTK